jgi:hypothetical protein
LTFAARKRFNLRPFDRTVVATVIPPPVMVVVRTMMVVARTMMTASMMATQQPLK